VLSVVSAANGPPLARQFPAVRQVGLKKSSKREGGTIATEAVKDKGNTLTVFVKPGNLPQVVEFHRLF